MEDEQRARLAALVALGWPDTRIAAELGIGRTTVRRARVALGVERPLGPVPRVRAGRTEGFLLRLTPDEIEDLHVRARAHGLSTQDYLFRLAFPDSP